MNIQRGIKISQYTKFYYALFTVEVPHTGSCSNYISNISPIQAQILKQSTKPGVCSS
jgi:hypothetical protein